MPRWVDVPLAGVVALVGPAPGNYVSFVSSAVSISDTSSSTWRLGTVNPVSGAVRLAPAGLDVYEYVWSPDGRRIALPMHSTGDLAVLDAEMGSLRALVDGPRVARLDWLPDGRSLLCCVSSGRDPSVFAAISIEDGSIREYARLPFRAIDWSWSPDRRRIIFEVIGDDQDGLHVFEVTTGMSRRLTNPEALPYAECPDWSPDGVHIAFRAHPDVGEAGLYVMTGDGVNAHRVADLYYGPHEHVFSWSPDGSRLAFMSDGLSEDDPPLARVKLGIVEPSGSGRRWLDLGVNADGDTLTVDAPAWSPDGQSVAYSSYVADGHNIFVAAADSSAPPRRVTHDVDPEVTVLKYRLAWRTRPTAF